MAFDCIIRRQGGGVHTDDILVPHKPSRVTVGVCSMTIRLERKSKFFIVVVRSSRVQNISRVSIAVCEYPDRELAKPLNVQ